MKQPPQRLILITGPPGSGKTSVLTALADALSDDDIPHAAVEVEALAWTHPPLGDERRLAHVRTVCAGHGLVLLADTAETPGDLAALIEASGADEAFVARLDAPPDTLAARITEREPASWSGTAALAAHARELAVSMSAVAADLVVSTEGARAEDIAARIRQDARL